MKQFTILTKVLIDGTEYQVNFQHTQFQTVGTDYVHPLLVEPNGGGDGVVLEGYNGTVDSNNIFKVNNGKIIGDVILVIENFQGNSISLHIPDTSQRPKSCTIKFEAGKDYTIKLG